MYSLNSQISPASNNRALIHHESAKSLRPGQSLISSPRYGYCDVFFWWKNFRKVFGSGQSDASSGTSMTTYCVVNSNSKLSILLRCYFHGVLEQLKTNFQTNFRFKKVLDFVIEYA